MIPIPPQAMAAGLNAISGLADAGGGGPANASATTNTGPIGGHVINMGTDPMIIKIGIGALALLALLALMAAKKKRKG